MKMHEMDTQVSVREQMATELGPVVLINVFHVSPDEAAPFVAAWTDDARYFKRQAGFISTQLHRGLAGSGTFLNYAIWESTAHFRRAFESPEFRAKLASYPTSTIASPHLFQKVAVSDLCTS
jgi:heme-degrading monooxygenase HmoA